MRFRALIIALVAVCIGFLTACSASPADDIANSEFLTYEQIKGSGLANKCPQLSEISRGSIPLDDSQSYVIRDMCLEPTNFFVKEEPVNKRQEAKFVPGRLLSFSTKAYSLLNIEGPLNINEDKSLTFEEKDGLDFQAITVGLPGGESIPFLFTIKGLVAKTQSDLTSINTSTDFTGSFRVPSYRGATFLDPKGRGLATGYDNAVALPAEADNTEYSSANVKKFSVLDGEISMSVAKVDSSTGEIAGTFESIQPSDTDLGADEPEDVKIRGLFYARIEPSDA
ncbi:photosystem II manganese-stabilizing polypeptide [Calothrix rhizosoleniae]|uniref:photosystem II manganese-stabilizing polypeptide n=1 Tax=Calothrix rhizosoleniae TaxID=888997 RepID=UPI000B49EFE2|nr:photosystem II manganese-stabilizing polypeptide [Calothrix rhizosoleniae]